MAEVASESWWIKLGVMYDKSGFKAAIGGMLDLQRAVNNLAGAYKKIVDTNSDLYNTARYLNVSTSQLQTWERTFKLIGGSADEARQNIANLNFVYDQLRLGQGGEKAELAARLHLNMDDLLTYETAMEGLNRSFNTYFQGDYGAFKVLAEQLGLSQYAIKLVTQSTEDYKRSIAEAQNIPLIPEHQIKAAEALRKEFVKLSISWDNFKNRIISASFPALNKIFKDIEHALADPNLQKRLVEFFEELERQFNNLAKDQGIVHLIDQLAELAKAVVTVMSYSAKGIALVPKFAGAVGTGIGTTQGFLENALYQAQHGQYKLGLLDAFNPARGFRQATNNMATYLTQTITLNGVANPNDAKEAVVASGEEILRKQQIDNLEKTREY